MVQRLTYRRRHPYNTKSNKVKIVKTPGGVLTFHYRTKKANGPKCGDCGGKIIGVRVRFILVLLIFQVPALRPSAYSRVSKRIKHVSRSYGGSRCGSCVRDRIVRAFLVEEQKIVKHVMKRQHETNKKPKQKNSQSTKDTKAKHK
eukprot:TRINITY_DN1910_c0_g1_i2.p1 TRINITY_DN1910_c0_g1~~TRINITY_DN1910_c0_g1_i2.p1  ORF type:complete len:145 (-),score=0.59 TRINITY_DN1910_c0_g1_i2:132-566(-)